MEPRMYDSSHTSWEASATTQFFEFFMQYAKKPSMCSVFKAPVYVFGSGVPTKEVELLKFVGIYGNYMGECPLPDCQRMK